MEEAYRLTTHPLLIVISGPAGVGKDAVLDSLRQWEHPLHFVVTATDRPPRPGEIHGVDYFFYTPAEFERMIEQDELLEHALVYGQHKGIPKQQVREAIASGKDVIMRLDVQGAATVRRIAPEALLIFLFASKEELIQRMTKRDSDTAEQIERRLAEYDQELAYIHDFDYVVINRQNQFPQAVAQVKAIIQAEHCRVKPRRVRL